MQSGGSHALRRESVFLQLGVEGYENLISDLETEKPDQSSSSSDSLEALSKQKLLLLKRLEAAQNKKKELAKARNEIADQLYNVKRCERVVEEHINDHWHSQSMLNDELDSVQAHLDNQSLLLTKFMKLNPINDAFHIWYCGPFATINEFRLGRLPSHQLDWSEINAALGEAASAMYTISKIGRIPFRKYCIYPMGSFTRIGKVDDARTQYNLFTDGSFSLFPKRNFNAALGGLLCCIDEIGEHVLLHDPTLQLPYKINTQEGKINNHSISVNSSDEEQWTKALKYMLSDIKWIIAWSTKHLQHIK